MPAFPDATWKPYTAPRARARRAWVWRGPALTLCLVTLLTASSGAGAAVHTSAATESGALASVIVRYRPGATGVEAAVTALGGDVGRRFPTIDGFQAQLPEAAVEALAGHPGVLTVTPDASVALHGNDRDGFHWRKGSEKEHMYLVPKDTGARSVWGAEDTQGRDLIGTGVGVALIDSGVISSPALAAPRVVNGPDLSFESQAENLRHLDTYGHGTHMAGIIAGADPRPGKNQAGRYVGIAPGATLLNMKVASSNGATDVSQVIAAIDWVVQHKDDPRLKVRVLNLSFGSDALQPAAVDPLAYAAEVAWRNGIVVVVAAGNDGNTSASLTNPAINPFVIAVGAANANDTNKSNDDTIATFSNRGSAARVPDFVAPGQSIVSFRDPGSYIDVNHPEGRISNKPELFRGSGTSQAAAVVSGAVALLLQQRPNLTPDQVKRILAASTDPLPRVDRALQGAGVINIKNALKTPTPTPAASAQPFVAATGLGSLELARGDSHIMDTTTGDILSGEQDIFGAPWTPSTWAPAAAAGSTWRGGEWNGHNWSGDGWTGSSWAGSTWRTEAWTGSTWRGSTWRDASWTNVVWTGSTWRGLEWGAGSTWRGSTWRMQAPAT